MAIIEVKDLSYSYGEEGEKNLRNVSFSVAKGEFVLLTGPSGCGKTTLCRCFNGLIPHFYGGKLEGSVTVAGQDVAAHAIHEIAPTVGFVFQNPENQLFALTVERDVAFGLENLGFQRDEVRKRVEWALDVVDMRGYRYAAPYELSGGQQQRVAIASILAMQPDVLVLDEPTSFLDPLSSLKVFEILRRLNREFTMTVVLVEHRLDLVSGFVDRVMLMNDGQVVLDGEPRTILSLEEAKMFGVGVPKIVRLFNLLKGEGFKFNQLPLTPQEATRMLREALKP